MQIWIFKSQDTFSEYLLWLDWDIRWWIPRGDTLIFFICRLGPRINHSLQKNIRNFKHLQKIFEYLITPNIPSFCILTLRKDHKIHRMTPKYSPILSWPLKISTKSSYPKNIHFFWKPQKYWNSNFEPQKMTRAYVCMQIADHPPPPPSPEGGSWHTENKYLNHPLTWK